MSRSSGRSAKLTRATAKYYRGELRAAREAVLADAEAYARPLQAFERLGGFLKPRAQGLAKLEPVLMGLGEQSPLAEDLPHDWPEVHRPLRTLLSLLREARNDVMHVGAQARSLTSHAVAISLILEDALDEKLTTAGDFMVASPVTVERWQPVSHARQLMLLNSFSFIPVVPEGDGDEWRLLADYDIARYLRSAPRDERRTRLTQPLHEAMGSGGLKSSAATLVDLDEAVSHVVSETDGRPVLVQAAHRGVVGILTAFDLL